MRRCRSTAEWTGRRCERRRGHDGEHVGTSNGIWSTWTRSGDPVTDDEYVLGRHLGRQRPVIRVLGGFDD